MKNLIEYVIMNDESLLYDSHLERVKGIEPSYPAWKAGALADVLYPHKGKPARGTAGFRMEIGI